MREHGASPVTVQRAIASLAAEGVVVPRPGRGTFVAAPPASNGAADLAWQEVALGAPRVDSRALSELLDHPAGGHARAQLRLPRPAPAADRGAGRRARPRRPPPRRVGARGGRGRRRAADLVRARGGRALRRPRRRHLPRRAGRARDRRARARAAGRPGGGRVADLPRRARGGPRRRPDARSRSRATPTACAPRCSPTRSSAPAPASPTCSRCTPTRTAPTCRPSAAPR